MAPDLVESYRSLAVHARLRLLLVCRELLETGERGYTSDEDNNVFKLANVLHEYTTLRAILNDQEVNTL
jgi:hypothetical protein